VTLPAGRWRVDPSRSRASFRVKHLGFVAATGEFTKLEGELETSTDGEPMRASGSAKVSSVHTGEPSRDEFLASAGFFDTEKFPRISFVTSEITVISRDELHVTGELTLHGVTRPATLRGRIRAADGQSRESERIELSLTGELRRSEHGLAFPQAAGAANNLVADKVRIELEVSAAKIA